MDNIQIIKATGEKAIFDEKKLLWSIRRAGVPENLQFAAISHVRSILRPGITTREIYDHAVEFLGKSCPSALPRFTLRDAIMKLGPTGYPFEKYLSDVLTRHGYTTQTNLILQGKCVSHEIDVQAEKDADKIMIECKFHNQWGERTNVKTALYIKSRFDDLKENNNFTQGWLVTNTKCTFDAIEYANCSGLKIISWNYPEKGNLAELIEAVNFFPSKIIPKQS